MMNQDFRMGSEYENVAFPIIRDSESTKDLKNNMVGKGDKSMIQLLHEFTITKDKDKYVVSIVS